MTIWLITTVSFLFGVATGLVNSAAPQAGLAIKLSSTLLGLVGAGVPLGYVAGCLLSARVLHGFSGKRVLLCGVMTGALSLAAMAFARTALVLVAAQILFGFASGAVWPFISAWLLDHESQGVPKPRLLRHYNVSWTAGTAVGMFAGGIVCDHGWVFETFEIAVAIVVCAFIAGALGREIKHCQSPSSMASDPVPVPLAEPAVDIHAGADPTHRVTRSMLLAAVLFNLAAIGTKMVIAVNYTELNKLLGGGADRMGQLMAAGLLSQLAAFSFGRWYEPLLGLRRVYIVGAFVLIAVNLTFARGDYLPGLLAAEAATGFVLAMAFQCSMLAFTARSSTPRHGTTLLEMTVGLAGFSTLAAGKLSELLKDSGIETRDALRAPFYAGAGLIGCVLLAQLLMVPAEKDRRHLMLGSARLTNPIPTAGDK